jgi:ABC-type oligopeptide transport system ATPase subunit
MISNGQKLVKVSRKRSSEVLTYGWSKGELHAENVDITVRRGETVGIVGESGSGKTTVARCVARLIEPTSGTIRIGDVDVAHLPESRLRRFGAAIGYVLSSPGCRRGGREAG